MKILHILGNGFDRNLGLKTSYWDFNKYYKSIKSSKKNIKDLKSSITNDYENWSDLELSFGDYTGKLRSPEDFDEVFEDIREKLAIYLKKEEDKFDSIEFDKKVFFEDLVIPEAYLSTAEKNSIIRYKNTFAKSNWYVDIVTFNYTTIVEKIIQKKGTINIGKNIGGDLPVFLRRVEHIHGYVDDRMVFGINDISQLKNKQFHQNEDVLEAIIKEKCNIVYGHTIDDFFKTKIVQADLICIFGISLGDTDNLWWELIGEKLKTSLIPIIIFNKGKEIISPRDLYKNNRTKREIRNFFLKKTKLPQEYIDRVSDNIYVALDTEMFKSIINRISLPKDSS